MVLSQTLRILSLNCGRKLGTKVAVAGLVAAMSEYTVWDILLLQEVDSLHVANSGDLDDIVASCEPHLLLRHYAGPSHTAQAVLLHARHRRNLMKFAANERCVSFVLGARGRLPLQISGVHGYSG